MTLHSGATEEHRLLEWRLAQVEAMIGKLTDQVASLTDFRTELRAWTRVVTWAITFLTTVMAGVVIFLITQVLRGVLHL